MRVLEIQQKVEDSLLTKNKAKAEDPLSEGAAGPAGGASAGEENGELLQVTLLETKVDFLCPSSLGNKAFCVRLESSRMLKAVLDFIAPDCQAALLASKHSSCSKAE